MIQLYIYRLSDGLFLYQDIGSPNGIINDLGNDKDFTLQPLPDHDNQWFWYDNQWHDKPQE